MTAHAIIPGLTTHLHSTAPRSTIGTGRLSFVVILYLITIVLPIHYNVGAVFMTATRTLLLVTTVPIAIRLFSGQLGRVLPADVLLLIYVIWAIFTLYLNSPSQAISFGGSYALEAFGSYLVARCYIRTPEQFLALCWGLLAALIFTLPFAVYETQTGRALLTVYLAKLPGIESWGDYYNLLSGRRLGLERSQVIFSHPIHYGLFSASMISLALVALKGMTSTFKRYLLAASVCLGVMCSVSSGAILPMMLQFGLMAWAWIFRKNSARWHILTVLVVIAYVVVDMISNRSPITVLISRLALSSETAWMRIVIFEWGMRNVWANPYFGIGMNDWVRPDWKSSSMDNFWLVETVRYGIPGFLLLVSGYFGLVWAAMRRDLGDSGPAWQFRRAWVFMQVGLIITLVTVHVWTTALSYVFFLLGSGAWFATASATSDTGTAAVATTSENSERAGPRYTRFTREPEHPPQANQSRRARRDHASMHPAHADSPDPASSTARGHGSAIRGTGQNAHHRQQAATTSRGANIQGIDSITLVKRPPVL